MVGCGDGAWGGRRFGRDGRGNWPGREGVCDTPLEACSPGGGTLNCIDLVSWARAGGRSN